MRVLALRGENLASLAARFELDLAQGPLAESGLIAITGPTGAGKSTLLDAMCLALFDRTPRLGGRGAAVGFLHEEDQRTLSSGDPRCVLRRGASSGFAEVDFQGARGERWRARWSVRRARGRAQGRLQAQSLSLENLDTGILAGGTKTQTLAAIEEALGLDYDGFCRSALLAQGEFAGFLRARPEERAALLERVTGTEIYGQLSIAAHQRSARAREGVALLEARLGGFRRLPPAEREALSSQLTHAEGEARAAAQALSEAEEALAWHEQHRSLRACASHAEGQLTHARAAWEAQAPRRRLLAAWELVQPLALLQRAEARAQAVLADAERELTQSAAALDSAKSQRDAEFKASRSAHAEGAEAEQELRQRGPKLRQATSLERSLAERDAQLARAEAALTAAKTQRLAAQAAADAASRAARGARETRNASQAELATDPVAASLAQEATSWDARLARLSRAATDLPTLEAQASELRAQASTQITAAELLSSVADAATRAAADASAAFEGTRDLAATWTPQRVAWTERRLRLVELREARLTALAARLRERGAQDEAAEAEQEVASAEAGVLSAREAEAQALAAAAEAERAWVLIERTLQLSDLRHELREGEACALCGAEEHPYAEDLPPLDAALAAQRGRVQALQEEIRTARGDQRALTERCEQARARATHAAARGEAAASAASEAEARWLELAWRASWTLGRAAATLGPDAPAERLGPDLDQALSEAEEELATLAKAQAEREAQAQALNLLQGARAEAREAALKGEQARREAEAQASQATQRAEHIGAKVTRGLSELRAAVEEASAALACNDEAQPSAEGAHATEGSRPSHTPDALGEAWETEFRADANAFTDLLRGRVAAARAARARLDAARAELEVLEPRAAASAAEVKAALRELQASESRRDEIAAARALVAEELQALALGTRLLPSQALAELEARVDAAHAVIQAKASALTASESALAAAEARAAQVKAGLDLARQAATARSAEHQAAREEALTSLARRLTPILHDPKAEREGARVERGNRQGEDPSGAPGDSGTGGSGTGCSGTGGSETGRSEAGDSHEALDLEALVEEALAWSSAGAEQARADEERLRDALRSAEHELRLRRETLRAHQASGAPKLSADEAAAAATSAGPRRLEADETRARLRGALLADEAAKAEAETLGLRLERERADAERWHALSKLIGSHDGKRLRVFAQSLTLELLLDQANAALEDLAPRYRLARVAGQDLDLQVIDTTLGDEVRATSSLSGGESFLVSLALALGVGGLSSQDAAVESLFVDEGFGSLDADAQELALAALDALQAGGRQVVLISHLPGLAERIGFGVRVVPEGRGQSRIEVGALQALNAF